MPRELLDIPQGPAGLNDLPGRAGDEALFWDQDNWQPLCKTCRDGAKAELENTGRIRGCDVDGRPLDQSHPWNQ